MLQQAPTADVHRKRLKAQQRMRASLRGAQQQHHQRPGASARQRLPPRDEGEAAASLCRFCCSSAATSSMRSVMSEGRRRSMVAADDSCAPFPPTAAAAPPGQLGAAWAASGLAPLTPGQLGCSARAGAQQGRRGHEPAGGAASLLRAWPAQERSWVIQLCCTAKKRAPAARVARSRGAAQQAESQRPEGLALAPGHAAVTQAAQARLATRAASSCADT